jgi:hypothetical protein
VNDKEIMLNALRSIENMEIDITNLQNAARDITTMKAVIKSVLSVVDDE